MARTQIHVGQSAKGSSKCGIRRWNCIQAPYQRFMYKYGLFVDKHPWWFIIAPLVACLALTTGLYFNMITYSSVIGLYAPQNSKTYESESRVRELFPMNSSEFVAQALVDNQLVAIMAEASNGNVLDGNNLRHILNIDTFVRRNLTTSSGIKFEDVCARWHGECVIASPFLDIKPSFELFSNPTISAPSPNILNQFLGEVTFGADSKSVQKARYMAWSMFMTDDMKEDVEDWMTTLGDAINNEELDNHDVMLGVFGLFYLDTAIKQQENEITRQVIPAIALMVIFSTATCLMLDPVRSKPLLALAGVLSPGLAIGGAFGLLLYAGQPYTATVGLAPFLVIGIGVDGMFVLLSVWRRTSPYLPCEQRMALTFREGGVSITITALTDIVSMAVGTVNPFRAIEQFCRFAALATTFDLILQMTFFGGCLALTGQREEQNRHSLIPCLVLPAPSQARGKGRCSKLFCVGGVDKSHRSFLDNKRHLGSKFFGNAAANWFRNPWMIAIAVVLYICYIGGATYGFLSLQEDLKQESTGMIGTKMNEMGKEYSTQFQDDRLLMLVIDQNLTYSSPADQRKVFSLLTKLTQTEEAHLQIGPSWIQVYSTFLKENQLQPGNESEYISILRNSFLRNSLFEQFKVDIAFNSDFSSILASRIYLLYYNLKSTSDESRSLFKIREILENHYLNAFVLNYRNHYIEQYMAIRPITIRTLVIAFVGIITISLLFFPTPLITLVLVLSLASILFGIVGYMSLWDVRLDIMTLGGLLLSLGFIVDFSVHLAYVFVAEPTHNNLKYALSVMGYPLLQSALSTIVGIAILAFSVAPVAVILFKIIFILMVSGTFHGLLWIPLSLQFFMRCCSKPRKGEILEVKTSSKGLSGSLHHQNSAVTFSRRQRVSLQTINFSRARKFAPRSNRQGANPNSK